MIKEYKGIQIKDREISWLSFNERVLQEADDESVPLLERLKFLAIFSSNMDEFFRVRVASLRRSQKAKRKVISPFRLHPEVILELIQERAVNLQDKFNLIYENIREDLAKENVLIVNEKELTPDQLAAAQQYYKTGVAPYLFPVILDPKAEFPFLRDKSIYLAIKMSKQNGSLKPKYAIIEVPTNVINRFYILPSDNNKTYIILLDDVIRISLDKIFSIFDYDTYEAYTIKLTRDAELTIDNDFAVSYIEKVEKSLKERKKGAPVRFVFDEEMPTDLLGFMINKLKLTKQSLIPGGRYHNFKDFMDFPKVGKSYMSYEPLPQINVLSLDNTRVMFDAISKRDHILHHPYQTFDYVIRMLRESAIDPFVSEIKITLYRVAKQSNVCNALINAVKNGKKVTVLMELQARFDEEHNIYWANKLQEAGAIVLFGKPSQKVHCKICLIYRKENNRIVKYAHLGTGNYNGVTSRLYCDHGLLTKSKRLTEEVAHMFHLLSNPEHHYKFKYLLVAPISMKNEFLKLVENEIKLAKHGKPASIILKMNSLVDEVMIKKLYDASRAGVKIQLIIRGVCCLVPGVKKLSENVEVISIIDRYLEHARVYIFGNEGKEKMFLSSADWMQRNLNNRIEVAFPIHDRSIQKQIKDIINIQLKDNCKARIIDKSQSNHYKAQDNQNPIRAQYAIYSYIKSLSV
ncbi:MAG: polyphosphate kinase 1 [Bacteroidia bacterium]